MAAADDLEAFKKAHPLCIFCGGRAATETRDHVPSRQTFTSRAWPEGYLFPACRACNDATKHSEQVFALLTRTYPNPTTEAEHAELRKIMKGVSNNYPGVLLDIRPSARGVRRFFAERGQIKPLDRATISIPLLNLDGPLVRPHLATVARKIFSALHYMHSGKIIPPEGGIAWRIYSNTEAVEDRLPADIIKILGGQAQPVRSKKLLNDQFDYRYVTVDNGIAAAYFVTFRFSFAMLGAVTLDRAELVGFVPPDEIVLPRNPDGTTPQFSPTSKIIRTGMMPAYPNGSTIQPALQTEPPPAPRQAP